MADLKVLALGGCLLQFPFTAYRRARSDVTGWFAGGGGVPTNHTPADMRQFMRFLTGELTIPREMRLLTGFQPAMVDRTWTCDLDQADAVVVELNTPVQCLFDGYSLLRIAIGKEIVDPIVALHSDLETRKLAGAWIGKGLRNPDEAVRAETAPRLAKLVPGDWPEAELYREIILGVRATRYDITAGVKSLMEMVDRPFGLVTWTYRYMPDGRAISWPESFVSDVIAAGAALDIPVLQPAFLVQAFGVENAVNQKDQRHYSEAFNLPMGEALVDFAQNVSGRTPRLRHSRAVVH